MDRPAGAAVNGLSNGDGPVNGTANGDDPQSAAGALSSTTTISTVAVQAGKTKIVLAILKSHDWIRVRIQQMEPDLMEVGTTLEEAKALRREHEELLAKLNAKQRDITDALAKADNLATQNKSYQEVYAAMAESLSEAWIDLNKQLEYRKMLLDQSINFHESAILFAQKMEQAQSMFTNVSLAHDVDSARQLLQQHQDLKKNILESSMSTLQEGQLLLDRIREMGVHADVQNRHATTAACYGIEHLLELLQDRRRHLEELWLQRKVRLEQCLQLLLLDQEVNKVSDWFEKVGDVYLDKKDLGSSLAMANALREEHQHFEHQAREIQDTVLRLIRTADQLVHGERADAESVRKRLQLVDSKCETFTVRLDARRKNLAMARNFFSLAQTALTKLDDIEVQLASSGLPSESPELADRHRYLAGAIIEAAAPALREGHALLERVGRDEPGAQGVVSVVTELKERCAKLDAQCTAKHAAGERSQIFNQFTDNITNLTSWFNQIGLATVGLNGDMGANLSTSRDFLELHERLNEDLKLKKPDVTAMTSAADELIKANDSQGGEVANQVKVFREQWDQLEKIVQNRIRLAQTYVAFHKRAQQLAIQMDVLEEYLKIEKLDPTQIPDSAVQHKEENFAKMSSEFSEVENSGKRFIKDASETKSDEKLDTRRAVVVVETILSHFSERRYLITDYYEHWKVHVVTGKEFKSQWQQFIKDARKTIDWMVKEEKALFAPYNAGNLGSSLDEAKRLLSKVNGFAPTAKKAQEDVEALLKAAELLSMKGDTQGQRDQIVNELMRVLTRLQARVNEYRILLTMAVKFYEDLSKLDKAIETAEKEYSSADLPMEPTKAQLLLREHESSRSKIKHLVDFTSEEGEEIAVRVRQQESEAVARDEVQRVLQMTEERRRLWEKSWADQKARLEQNLQMCQFFFDLRQLHGELDELHRGLNSRRGAYGNSLATVKMTLQAFRQFERSVEPVEAKVRNFSNTADTLMRTRRGDDRRLRTDVDELKRKWNEFCNSIGAYRGALDESTKFFENMDNCDGWINEAGQFLLNVGRKATECKSSKDAANLIDQLNNFKEEGGAQQNERLNGMERIATALYGQVSGPQKMQHIVDRNQEVLGSFVKAIEELSILRDNLLKKEQILAQMEAVVEKKTPKQPRFVQPLHNAEISEGQRFTFECRLECDTKAPVIEWLKNGQSITNPDYKQIYRDGLCQLTIEKTFADDSATYTCKATTDAGVTDTSASLRVKETQHRVIAPEFVHPLRAVDAPEGTSVMLECHVTGVPVPSIVWRRDNNVITETSADYAVTQSSGSCCLKIKRVGRDHAGQYSCSATNSGGEASTSATVNVISVRKPQFLEQLQNVTVPEGKTALLKCSFSAEPPPQIQWLRNGAQVLPSAVYKITVEADHTSLEIQEAFPEDAGTYIVVARNLGGETRSTGTLTVESTLRADRVDGQFAAPAGAKPVFVQPLQNKEVQEGSRAHLMCVVTGQPQPEILWLHNDKPVRESKDFELLVEGDRCSLVIREVYLEDSGEYKCTARNVHGLATTSCRLMVEPLSELSDAGSTPIPGDIVPPKFTQLLKDIDSVEGDLVRFDCRVIGHPTPTIKWYRGRNLVQNSADFQISCERELHSLTIAEVFREDGGNYMVKASNAAGTAKCYAALTVKTTGEKHMVKTRLVESSHSTLRTVQAGHSPPEFTRLFRDTRVRPGEPCTLEVVIAGNPRPTVRWLFNNEPIVSPHFRISARPDGTHQLYIAEVFDDDAGRFSVLAENDAGKATCSALLVVVDESTVLPHDYSPPETPLTSRVAPLGFGPPPVVPVHRPVQQAPPPPRPIPSPASFREEIRIPEKPYQPVEVAIEIPVPPEFVEPLRDIAAAEGTRVTFDGCVKGGKPEPTIRWFRDGRPLTGGADFEITYSEGRVKLSIPEAFPEDSGKYTCSAENKGGKASSTAELVVKASMIPPQFADRLQTKEVKEGEAVRFTIRVTGKPRPEVTWYREGSQIVSSADFEIQQDGELHTLYIPEVFYEDSGKYTVKAESKAGQAQCTAELIVDAPSAVEESASPSPPISRSPSIGLQLAPPVRQPPQFGKPLNDRTARQGDRVLLECNVTPAFPPPDKVQWYRNEIEIFSSPDYTISFSMGGTCTLVIAEAFPEDSGRYTCTVTVNGLTNSTSMQLIIEAAPPPPRAAPSPRFAPSPRPVAPSPKPVATPQPEYRPLFEKQLTNQCLQHGGTAYFECKVDGYPPPEILWTRRGHPLVDKTRYKSTYDQYSGVTTLTIYNLRDEDEGEYMCKAINNLGESTTSATLLSQARFSDWKRGQQDAARTPTKFVRQTPDPVQDGKYSDYDDSPDGAFKVSQFEKRLNKEIDFRDPNRPDETSYVGPDALRRLMKSPGHRRSTSRERDPSGVSEQHFRPVFRKIPVDLEVPEGHMARFDSVVTGRPNPDMLWFRDGVQIFDDRLHKIVINEEGISSLIFDATSRSDSGHYTCIARNRGGEDSFQVNLNVLKKAAAAAPRFVDRLTNQTVVEGHSVQFVTEAVGVPVPMLSWQKDGKMLSDADEGGRYRIQTDGGRSSLQIAPARPEDSAWFQCTAASTSGMAANRARLVVQVETRRVTPERKLSIPKRVITPTRDLSQPTFQRRPSSEPMQSAVSPTPDRMRVITPVNLARPTELAPAGTEPFHRSHADIVLSPTPPPRAPASATPLWQPSPSPTPIEAAVRVPQQQAPPPTVAATVDSRVKPMPFAPPTRPSEVLKYIQDEEKDKKPHRRPSDTGAKEEPAVPSYVKSTELPPEDMFQKDKPRPPKFKTQMKPLLNLMENDSAHFECRLVPIGDPDMKIEWYKDGVLLKHGHRFRPQYDFGFVGLDILYVYPEDSGIYLCKATNKCGSDTNQVSLQCYGKESVIYETQLPEGIDSVQHIREMEDAMYNTPRHLDEDLPDRKAPIFDMLPEVVQVEEGETAKFMVKVSGNPRPRVTWWLNGTIVVNSHRFCLRYDGMIHILEIPKVRDYDSGNIRVVAKNPVGEAECSTTLTVSPRDDWRSRLKQAPRSTVEVELEKKKTTELRSFELDQALKKPKTTVVELRAFERSAQEKALSYRDDEVKKAFTDINMRHAQMSRSDASRELRMHEPNVHIESEVHVARAKAMLNMADDQRREQEHRVVGKTVPARRDPPTFTKPLQNTRAKEGQSIKLEVNYTGFPTPEIHWFREGVEIQPSRDFQISHLYQKSFLVVPEVFLEDAGTFTVRAISSVGMAECRALLVVEEDLSKVRDVPPEFRVQMHDITISVGEPATFDCQVSGSPRPDVFWTKDGRRIGESPRWKLIVEDDHYTMLIYEVHPEDAGLYECVVVNKTGKATCSARLNVSGKPEHAKPPSPPTAYAAPRLLEPMRDQQVREGDPVQFRCRISGTPDPVVQWYYNNQLVKPSKYFQLTADPSTGYYGLSIAGVFPEDDGAYKCVARNPAGEVTCIVQLRVIPLSSEQSLELSKQMDPPRFVKPINGLDVVDGGTAVFEVVVSGQPPPDVVWYHEGRPIQSGPDFQIVRDGNKHVLTIREVLLDDAGIFTCRATNPAGVAECSAELFVEDVTRVATAQVHLRQQAPPQQSKPAGAPQKKAPRVLRPPAPVQEVPVGGTAKLEVQLEAYPPPRIQWSTGSRQIHPSQRYDVRYDSNTGVVVLLILNAQPQDSGEYQLRATNELGEITCKTVLNIKPKEKTVELSVQPQQQQPKHVVSKDMIPVFIVPLKPETRVHERTVTRLECQVRAYPLPSVTWHVNGVELPPSAKFFQTVVGEQVVLEIRDVAREDTGVYTCRARSAIGEASTATQLIVLAPEPKPVPPHFTKNLENIVATDGREVTMSCIVAGVPAPDVSWYHNHKNIDQSEDFVITYDRATGRVDLVIVDCLPDDQGRFRCIAKNPAGQAVTECTLTVKSAAAARPVTSTTIVPTQAQPREVTHTIHVEDVQRDTLEIEEQKTITDREVLTVVQKVVKRTSGQPPRFTRPIQPCVVREADSCTFTATVTGAPVPDITWLKDKVDLVPTERHHSTFNPDTGECTLTITNSVPNDVGVYSCRATNIAGRATCTANVVVVPPDAEVTITEKTVSVKKEKVTMVGELETRVVESSPTFNETLMPLTEVTEGDVVKFQCQVTAEPEPTLTWLYNGRELTSTSRIQLTFDKTTTTLTITGATVEDSGEYLCRATNALGEAITKTFLRVRPLHKEPVRPIAAPQPSDPQTHEVTIQFGQTTSTTTTEVHSGSSTTVIPHGQLSAPYSVIPLHADYYEEPFEPEEEPPRFTLPLRNQTVNDGDRAQLRVFFRGTPTPKVTWYFNSQPVRPGQDFQIEVDSGRGESTLVIVEVFPEDEGEYMCKAENPMGTAITHCHLFVRIPTSSEDESVEKIVSKTVEVVKTEQPITIRETRRFSETIAIDHRQKLQEMALQFKLPQPRREKSELIVRRESEPKGMKMEIRLSPPKTVSKTVELKQHAEAVATQRQEVKIPLKEHRRFSETVAIDHRARPQELQVQFQLPKPRVEKSQLIVQQKAAPKGVKMEVEVPKPTTKELSKFELQQLKHIEAIETQRQEFKIQLEGSPPVFIWELQSQKVMDGDETRFVAKVRGNPMPDITWYHDGKVVYDNPDFRTSYNKETGEVVLFIVEVFPQDTGRYECTAVNKYGQAATSAQLNVEVYEYVPDSEEATASQTESIISTSSMDETDFQAKTKRFLENMEKLRKDIHEENVIKKFAEELIEQSDIEEQGYEETSSLADVKWQIPKRVQPKHEDVPIEDTEDVIRLPSAEEPHHSEIAPDVGVVHIGGLKPTRVVTQTSRQLEESAVDLYATGAEMSEQKEIAVEFSKPDVRMKKETRTMSMTERMAVEAAEDFTDSRTTESMQEQEYVVDLAKPRVEQKRVTRVQSLVEKTAEEAALDLVASAASETTQHEEYFIDLLRPVIEPKRETKVESVVMRLTEEDAVDFSSSVTESSEQREIPSEFVQPAVEGKAATRVAPIVEKATVEGIEELTAESSEISREEQIVVELAQPSIRQKQASRAATLIEKTREESADDLIGEASEATQEEKYQIELVEPSVEGKMETRVLPREERPAIEGTEELMIEVMVRTSEQEITVDMTRQDRTQRNVMLIAPMMEQATIEHIVELPAEVQETTKEQEIVVEIGELRTEEMEKIIEASTREEKTIVHLTNVELEVKQEEEQMYEEESIVQLVKTEFELEMQKDEQLFEEEAIVQLIKTEVELEVQKDEQLFEEESIVQLVKTEIEFEMDEQTQEEEDIVQLIQTEVHLEVHEDEVTVKRLEKVETAVDVVDKLFTEEFTSVIEILPAEQTQEEEFITQMILTEVEQKPEMAAEIVQEETKQEVIGEVEVEKLEELHEEQVTVELAKTEVELKQEMAADIVVEKLDEEFTSTIEIEAIEQTKQEEITIQLVQTDVEVKQNMLTEVADVEKLPEESVEELQTATTDVTQEQQIIVEMAKPSVENIQSTCVVLTEEKAPVEAVETISAEVTAETQHEEIFVQLVQTDVEQKHETVVAPVFEQLQPELTGEISVEASDTSSELQIIVEYSQPIVDLSAPTLVQSVEEKANVEDIQLIHVEATAETHQDQIDVSYEASVLQPKNLTLAAPIVEQLVEELTGDITAEVLDISSEQQIFVDYGKSSVETKTQTLVRSLLEQLAVEGFDEVLHVTEETPKHEEITIDLAQPYVEASRPARTSTQTASQPEETTEGVIRELAVEVTSGEEIHVHLERPTREIPQSSLTATLVEKLSEEDIQDFDARTPMPFMPEGTEVALDFGTHEVGGLAETRTEAMSEVLSVSSVEENLEEMAATIMEGEEITYDLSETTVRTKELTMVGVAETHLSEEEEEDIFHDATEPSVPGHEVVVDLAAADVRKRPHTLVAPLRGNAEVGQVEMVQAEVSREQTTEEEVPLTLVDAKKELPRMSLVKLQEAVMVPMKTDELAPDDRKEEISNESMTAVELDKAAAELPKQSLVSIQEQVLNMQRVMGMGEYHEEWTSPAMIANEFRAPIDEGKPLTLVRQVEERAAPEAVAEEYVNTIKEVYMIPSEVQPSYEPSVVERYRFETRVHGLEHVESQTSKSTSLGHVQQYSTSLTTETTSTLANKTEIEWHIMREDNVVEGETAIEMTHQDHEMVSRLRADESFVSAMSLMAPVFELPLSDVTIIDGQRAILECRIVGMPRAEVTWFVDGVEIRQSEDFQMTSTEDGWYRLVIIDTLVEDEGEYTVKAVNEAGTCVSTAYLTVLPSMGSEPTSPKIATETIQQDTMLRLERRVSETHKKHLTQYEESTTVVVGEYKAPQFTTKLVAREVLAGHTVVLNCHVVGQPEPEIVWYQDGKRITSSSRMQIDYSEGKCTLTIDSITVDDESEYMCEARNEHGVATTWAELLVESKPLYGAQVMRLHGCQHAVQHASMNDTR